MAIAILVAGIVVMTIAAWVATAPKKRSKSPVLHRRGLYRSRR